MKNLAYFVLFACLITACAPSDSSKEKSQTVQATTEFQPFTNVAVADWKSLAMQKEGVILDVRTPQEVAVGKIPNAVAIDFRADDFQTKVVGLDLSKPVYVYCAVGGRSSQAMKLMQTLGFKEVYNLDGGFKAWNKAGYAKE